MISLQTLRTRLSDLRGAIAISPLLLTVLTIAFVFVADNGTFWSTATQIFSGHPLSYAGYMLAVFSLTLALFSLFAYPWTVKPFLGFIVILSAITSYYVDALGVIIDRDMIQNVMVTTIAESRHLITAGFVIHAGSHPHGGHAGDDLRGQFGVGRRVADGRPEILFLDPARA
mgnify:CR=1 FL=1